MEGTGWHAEGRVMVVENVAKASLKTIAAEEIESLLRIIRFNALSEVQGACKLRGLPDCALSFP